MYSSQSCSGCTPLGGRARLTSSVVMAGKGVAAFLHGFADTISWHLRHLHEWNLAQCYNLRYIKCITSFTRRYAVHVYVNTCMHTHTHTHTNMHTHTYTHTHTHTQPSPWYPLTGLLNERIWSEGRVCGGRLGRYAEWHFTCCTALCSLCDTWQRYRLSVTKVV